MESKRSRYLFESGEFIDPYEIPAWRDALEGGCNGYIGSRDPENEDRILVFELYGVSVPDRGDLILLYDIVSIWAEGLDETHCTPFPMKAVDGQEMPGIERAANSLDPLVTMLRLLHDASIPVRQVPVPERLNKARRKAGRGPLPGHMVVDTRDYVSAFHAARSGPKAEQHDPRAATMPRRLRTGAGLTSAPCPPARSCRCAPRR